MTIDKSDLSANSKHKSHAPRILMGGLQQGEDDLDTPALIAVSYSSLQKAQTIAKYLLAIQNGVQPFSINPGMRAGDNVIKLNISPKAIPGKGYLCEVRAKADPDHLTHCFYHTSYHTEQEVNAFFTFLEIAKHYIFTVAHQDNLLLKTINLIKYNVTRRGV